MERSVAVPVKVQSQNASVPWLFGMLTGVLTVAIGVQWLAAIGIGAFTYYFVRFIQEAGSDVPIESFILVITSLQWIVGPVLDYAGFSDHYKYRMYVPIEEYMALAVPGVIMLAVGLYAFRSRRRIRLVGAYIDSTWRIVRRGEYLPYYLIAIGFVFSYLVDRFPPALAFPAYILSNIKYIGLIYLLFSEQHRHKGLILIVAFILTFLSSLKGAMFHDLLLWSAFIGMYAAFIFRPSFAQKLLVACLGFAFIFVLQSSKDLYREKLQEEGRSQYVSKFVTSVEERLDTDNMAGSSNLERLVVRINQGWIISRIMYNVPDKVPHAGGETVATAVKASLLPRILFPDKPIAGGKENFEQYTRFDLQSSTSMGISLLGEAYINYGLQGAWLFMLIFGLVASFIIRQFFLLAKTYPTIWLWFPLILLHFVKAETELLVQLNFLVKSIVLVYAFVWANKYFLKLNF